MAITLVSDNFNRANENPLGNGVWTTGTSQIAMQIVGNIATPTSVSSTDCCSRYSGLVWPDDQFSRAKLSCVGTAGGGAGVCLHVRIASGALTYYRLACDHAATNNIDLKKAVAGVFTSLTGFPLTQAWTDGDTWELQVVGSKISVWRNGAQVGSTATDTAIASGSPGIGFSSTETSANVDDWEGGPITSGGGVGSSNAWWYGLDAMYLALMPAASGGSNIAATDSPNLTDAVTAVTLAAVPTDSPVLSSEARSATAAVVATDSLAVSEVPLAALVSSNQVATDNAAVSEAVAVVAAAVKAESLAVTESVGAIPVTLSANDSAAMSETRTATAAVNATDSLAVSESIGTSTSSASNISTAETFVISESIVATLIAAAIESATVSDTVVPVGTVLVLDSLGITESPSLIAPFVGIASIGSMSLGPRVFITAGAGVSSWTWDSTYVRFDSTLFTFDGGYLAVVPADIGIAPNVESDVALDERVAAELELA